MRSFAQGSSRDLCVTQLCLSLVSGQCRVIVSEVWMLRILALKTPPQRPESEKCWLRPQTLKWEKDLAIGEGTKCLATSIPGNWETSRAFFTLAEADTLSGTNLLTYPAKVSHMEHGAAGSWCPRCSLRTQV